MKLDQFSLVGNSQKGTDIATIFLDNNLHVKRFTSQARDVFHLIQSDMGRPLSDIVSALHYDRLVQDAQEVLQTLGGKDQEVQADMHAWYLMRMRPYRTARNVIDGVVLTFIDITALKRAEEAAVIARRLADNIVQAVHQPLLILDAALHVVSANESFYQHFHLTPEEIVHQSFHTLDGGQWDIPALHQQLAEVIQHDTIFENFEMAYAFPQQRQGTIRLNARQIQQLPAETPLILLAIDDISPQPQAGESLSNVTRTRSGRGS